VNKKIEHLITAGMIAALVAVFFYQVAYGATITDVTKKVFNVGFKLGKADGIHRYFSAEFVDKANLTSQQQSSLCDQGYS
jgi:hypothetical protein